MGHIVADQPLVSVETDKVVVEVPSRRSGRIAHLFGATGELVKVGAILVEFAEGAEADTGTVVGELGGSAATLRGSLDGLRHAASGRPSVMPAVRMLARRLDVDLNVAQGTGPVGKITRADAEKAIGGPRSGWRVWQARLACRGTFVCRAPVPNPNDRTCARAEGEKLVMMAHQAMRNRIHPWLLQRTAIPTTFAGTSTIVPLASRKRARAIVFSSGRSRDDCA